MSILGQLKEELQDLTNEEKKELMGLLEEKREPESRNLEGSVTVVGPRGPHGEALTAEQLYDYEHPRPMLIDKNSTETIYDFNGKKTVRHYTPEEIKTHNDRVIAEWIEAKRKYAARHGLHFSDEYHPPVDYLTRRDSDDRHRPSESRSLGQDWMVNW